MTLDFSPYKPVLIAGPTASGKSQMALDLAARLDGVIINADALQVYSCWQSLSARPTSEDLARATHLLYGHIELAQDYSVGHWLRDVADQLQILQKAQKIPIIVGGTGLYFTALTEGLANIPPITAQTRALADARRIAGDLDAMCAELDPATLARIDKKKRRKGAACVGGVARHGPRPECLARSNTRPAFTAGCVSSLGADA